MKHPFNMLTLADVEKLRKYRSCIPIGSSSVLYHRTMEEILSAQDHLKSLYKEGGVTLTLTERILLLNDIY